MVVGTKHGNICENTSLCAGDAVGGESVPSPLPLRLFDSHKDRNAVDV